MVENLDTWDFELSKEDTDKIAKMDLGHSEMVDHISPEFVKYMHRVQSGKIIK